MLEFITEHYIISGIVAYFVIIIPLGMLIGNAIRYGMGRDIKTGEEHD